MQRRVADHQIAGRCAESAKVSRDDGAWRPDGFVTFRDHYPATPDIPLPSLETTERFVTIWESLGADPVTRARDLLAADPRGLTVVLVRGYLGNYMRGNLVPARDALRAAGVDAFIARNRAGASVADNARRVARTIVKHLDFVGDRTLLLGGHSKGGLECLRALCDSPAIAERTRAVLLSQTPRGPSAVLESLLLREHQASLGSRRRWAERAQRLGITLLAARRGGLDLTRRHLPGVVAELDAALAAHAVPVIQTASWSTRPTVWLDSFHERLGEIRPGAAHDGQFYLEDLIWPGREHVLLPHLDHAQPVMDGFGFDSARYWLALVVLATTALAASR